MISKTLLRLLPVVLAGGLLLAIAPPRAEAAWSTCTARVDRKAAQLSNDVYHHGQYSWQANRDRRDLARLRQFCELPAPPPQTVYRAPAQPNYYNYNSYNYNAAPPRPVYRAPAPAPYYPAPYPPGPYYRGY